MSCSIVSMSNVGEPYIIRGDYPRTERCYKSITCGCDYPGSPNPGRTWELICHGVKGEQDVLWGQDVEVCYSCESSNGCIFDYCEVKPFKYTTTETIECTAGDNDCECPNNPYLETVSNPCA